MAAIGLQTATEGDINIFKFIMYQTVTKAAIRAIGIETGLFTPINEDSKKENRIFTIESLIGISVATFICYCYVFEAPAMGKSLMRTINKAAALNADEMRFFDIQRAINELN